MTKICTGCSDEKKLSAFSKHPKGKFGRNAKCKKCKNAMAKAYFALNKDDVLFRQRTHRQRTGCDRKRKYGLEPAQFDAMVEAVDGKCQICGVAPEALCVDHSHTTGIVRGLLCKRCNYGLGMFRDKQELLLAAAAYLKVAEGAGFEPASV